MKIYTFGEKENPAVMLLPGTCCHWKSFEGVIPKLSENFYVIWMLLGWHTRRHAGGAGKCPNQWGQSIKESAVEVEKALAFPGIILYGVALFAENRMMKIPL